MVEAQNGRNLPAIRQRPSNPLLERHEIMVDEEATADLVQMLDMMDRELYVNDRGQVTLESFQRYSIDRGGQFAVMQSDAKFEDVPRVDSIEGIYLGFKHWRRYYGSKYNPSDPQPPACVSMDMVSGIGKPGIACNTCPHGPKSWPKTDAERAAWKGRDQRSPDCNDRIMLFIQPVDNLMPAFIDFPATNRKVIKAFEETRLRPLGVTSGSVIINVSLKRQSQTALFNGEIVSQVDTSNGDLVQVIANTAGYIGEALDNQRTMHLENLAAMYRDQGVNASVVDGKLVIFDGDEPVDEQTGEVQDGYFDIEGTWHSGDPPETEEWRDRVEDAMEDAGRGATGISPDAGDVDNVDDLPF